MNCVCELIFWEGGPTGSKLLITGLTVIPESAIN